MKKQILISLISISSILTINAQWNGSGTSPLWTNNNVGIGTPSPQNKLEVVGFGQFIRNTSSTSYTTLRLLNDINDPARTLEIDYSGSAYSGSILSGSPTGECAAITTSAAYPLVFGTNNTTRMTILNNGYIGIGTATPLSKLEVNGGDLLIRNLTNADNNSAIMISQSINEPGYTTFGTSLRTITQSAGGNTYGLQFFTQLNSSTGQTEKMRITGNGYVGIGTTNPNAKLEINSKDDSNEVLLRFNASPFYPDNYNLRLEKILESNGNFNWQFNQNQGYDNRNMMTFRYNGNIGIGCTTPDSKLTVNGTIHATEVKVDLLGGCDFVFKDDYKLMDLKKLEEFVKVNQHLPEIAPEKEMVENGVNMKELQIKLLQKMEEMTLYIIEQNKRIEKLENENIALKKK